MLLVEVTEMLCLLHVGVDNALGVSLTGSSKLHSGEYRLAVGTGGN